MANEAGLKLLNTFMISTCMGVAMVASPVFNRSEKNLSFGWVFIVLAILNTIVVYNSNRTINNVRKRIKNPRNSISDLGAVSAFVIAAWMSYAFGYVAIDYLGDIRTVFISIVLYSYIFIWKGASIVLFFSGNE